MCKNWTLLRNIWGIGAKLKFEPLHRIGVGFKNTPLIQSYPSKRHTRVTSPILTIPPPPPALPPPRPAPSPSRSIPTRHKSTGPYITNYLVGEKFFGKLTKFWLDDENIPPRIIFLDE